MLYSDNVTDNYLFSFLLCSSKIIAPTRAPANYKDLLYSQYNYYNAHTDSMMSIMINFYHNYNYYIQYLCFYQKIVIQLN